MVHSVRQHRGFLGAKLFLMNAAVRVDYDDLASG